jgi:hypothetical protein
MRRKIATVSVAAFAAFLVVGVSGASAFVANPTDTSVWRAFNSTAGPDRLGNTITNGDLEEMLMRWGNENGPITSTTYNSLSTAGKAFLDRIRDPATGNISNAQMQLFNAKEYNAEVKVFANTATSLQKSGTTALFKQRQFMGLAPRLLSTGAIVFTVASNADLVERAIVAGENKVFGWHIQLKGPFGIFGSWSGQSPSGTAQGTATVDGAKWRVETTQAMCGNPNGCTAFDPIMGASLGGPLLGSTDGTSSTLKLFALEPHFNLINNLGQTTFSAYGRDVIDVPRCTGGFWDGAFSSTPSTECSGSSDQSALQQSLLYAEMSPAPFAGSIGHGGAADTGSGVPLPGGPGWTSGSPGQWINTRNCSQSLGVQGISCVAYVMTEAQMEKFLGLKNESGQPQSWASEKNATTESTNIQGNIDPDQPAPTLNPNLGQGVTTPQTDTQRDTNQKTARDGTDNNASNWSDCYAAGNGGSGQTCPSPWEDGYTVPTGCIGATVSVCVGILQQQGFGGAHVDTTLGKDSADITLPAGSVVTIDPAGGSVVSPDQTFNFELNPSPLPVEIPQRLNGNEVATDWATRLIASGYTGTITYVTVDPNAIDASAGPGVETFPIIDTTTNVDVQPGDRIEPGDNITVYRNPDDTPPVSTSGGGTTCDCPPLDFTPLTGMGLGSKFPFGIFTYAAGIIGDFNVTAHAPDFNLRAQATGVNGHNLDAGYDVNLGDTAANRVGTQLNTYMGWWRDLLSFAMWVGALYWIGAKLLGFNGAGDPGGSVDEVL